MSMLGHVSQHVTHPLIQLQCWQHGDIGSIQANIVSIMTTYEDMSPTFPPNPQLQKVTIQLQ